MADALLDLMGLASIGTGHRQGLGKYLPVAFGIGAYHVSRLKHQCCQILCGYEDANDCNQLRSDSALKMSVGRKPSAWTFPPSPR